MDTRLMQWAVLIDLAILIVLSVDVCLTYQNYKNNLERGH